MAEQEIVMRRLNLSLESWVGLPPGYAVACPQYAFFSPQHLED
jgi:hypothetical protein